jgi:uncharacterized protein (DUF1697 family)
MSTFRGIGEALGYTDVETYLQSGNVVFAPAKTHGDLAGALEHAIADATGFDVPVLVRTGKELAKVVSANPYPVDDPTKVVVAFLGKAVEPAELGVGDAAPFAPDEVTRVGSELYISVPKGQGQSKLMVALTKPRQPTIVTVRNWRTVVALAEMTAR